MDYARKTKVKELNRILPMVRKHIKKERKINQLKKERGLNIDELEKIEASIKRVKMLQADIEGMPDVQSKIEGIGENLIELKSEQQSKEETITKEIFSYNETINMLETEWKFEHQLFQAISSVIATEEGFLEETEIKKEFLEEYIYLMSMKIDYAYKRGLKIETFLKGSDSEDKFFELIYEKFGEDTAYKIEALLKRDSSIKYFEIF